MNWQNKYKKAVTFSYDDGTTQDIRLVELLNKYGLKCTFNLNSQRLGKSAILEREGMRIAHYKLSPTDVKTVYEGHEIAAHSLTHPRLTELDEAEIIRQVEEDRVKLGELVGYEVVGFAYPCGGVNHDDRVVDIIKNKTNIKYCRTGRKTDSFDVQEDLYRIKPNVSHVCQGDRLMELAKRFVEAETDKTQIFYVYGHSFELDYGTEYWAKLEEFFEFISGRNDIFYGTNKDVLL